MGAIIKHSNLTPAGLPTTTCSNSLTPPCEPGSTSGEKCLFASAAAGRAACDTLRVLGQVPCTAVVTGTVHRAPTGCPAGHLAPLWPLCMGSGNEQNSPFIYHTRALTPQVQGSPQRMQGTSTTMYNSCFSSSHQCYLHRSPPPASPSSLPQRPSAQPATAIHHPKAALALPKDSGCHLPTQALAVSTDGHNQAVKFPRKLGGRREREESRTY